MLRTIAALSLAAMLSTSAIPAVAQSELVAERFLGPEKDETSFVEALGDLSLEDLLFIGALEVLVDRFADEAVLGEDTAVDGDTTVGEDVVGEEGATVGEDAVASEDLRDELCELFGVFCEESAAVSGSEFEQEAQSGDIALSNKVSNSGDNSNQSAPALQAANSGNLQSQVSFEQHGSDAGDIEVEGSSISVSPEQETQSQQEVQQSSTAK